MQTFLPYPDYHKSAECLDLKRLGKQIIEAQQIFKAITDSNYGWQNHPAVNMWRGFEASLYGYAMSMNIEWCARRGKNHGASTNLRLYAFSNDHITQFLKDSHGLRPWWLGDSRIHVSHQSNLLRKDPDYYKQYFPDIPDNLEYVWPV